MISRLEQVSKNTYKVQENNSDYRVIIKPERGLIRLKRKRDLIHETFVPGLGDCLDEIEKEGLVVTLVSEDQYVRKTSQFVYKTIQSMISYIEKKS